MNVPDHSRRRRSRPSPRALGRRCRRQSGASRGRSSRSTLAIAVALELWLRLRDASTQTRDRSRRRRGRLSLRSDHQPGRWRSAIMFATRVADEMVARGAETVARLCVGRRRGCAVGALAAVGSCTQACTCAPLRRCPAVPHDISIMQPRSGVLRIPDLGLDHRLHLRQPPDRDAGRGAHESWRRRAARDARRRTLESRLQALQARVEPQFLFNTLAKVRDAVRRRSSGKAAEMLEDLIVYLRAALAALARIDVDAGARAEARRPRTCSIMRAHLGDAPGLRHRCSPGAAPPPACRR